MSHAKIPSISVVVNTLNRAESLERTLESFGWQDFEGEFELIVVNGPSTDRTSEVLEAFADRIRVESCPVPNLSRSRNIGLTASRGDVVAFIDDDGVPESEWLQDLAEIYGTGDVGAAGGFVYDHTGRDFQYRFGLANRLGEAQQRREPTGSFAFPGAFWFPHLLGTNSSFRRDVALSLGGFDQEYEYFLDETDLLVRVLDAGWSIAQVEGAYVHHKFAPSSIRSVNKVARDRRSVIKNHTYFALTHAPGYVSAADIEGNIRAYVAANEAEMRYAASVGLLDDSDLEAFHSYSDAQVKKGRDRSAARSSLTALAADSGELERHPAARVPRQRVAIIPTDPFRLDYDRHLVDDVAERIAQAGDVPCLISPTTNETEHVDFHGGVWDHRIAASQVTWSMRSHQELNLIRSRRRVDEVLWM